MKPDYPSTSNQACLGFEGFPAHLAPIPSMIKALRTSSRLVTIAGWAFHLAGCQEEMGGCLALAFAGASFATSIRYCGNLVSCRKRTTSAVAF
jgi:hypothetical protein